MKSFCKFCIKALISGIIALFVLSLFCIMYYYTGVHVFNPNGATDYTWQKNQFLSKCTEGFALVKMDENGYNNIVEPAENIDILLMGSSNFEGTCISQDENLGYILNTELETENGKLYTYNIAISGHRLYTCIKNLKNALEVYPPQKYVIIETNTVSFDIDDMNSVINGTYPTIPSYDSGILYYMQKTIPATKNIYRNLDDWISAGQKNDEEVITEEADYTGSEYKEVLDKFISFAAADAEEAGVRLIIFYHSETDIDENGNIIKSTDKDALNAFESVCENNNVIFVDMTEDIYELYENEHILARGFINSSVGKGHVNKYGQRIFADRLMKVIGSLESRKEAE